MRRIAGVTGCAASVALCFGVAWGRPRPERRAWLPLRVIAEDGGRRVANCVFAAAELPERAGASAPRRGAFTAGEPIWGRCFLPDPPGPNQPRDLVDHVFVDGQLAWEQAYDRALDTEARSRSVPYSDVLRTLFASLKPGRHRIEIVGKLRRAGKPFTLYRGEFRYVR